MKDKGQLVQEVRLHEISQVNVFGAVTVTGPALQALCWAEKPVAHFSMGGWFAGMTTGMGLKNVFLRIAQVRRSDDPAFTLAVARDFVATKIRNQRTLLQRNHVEPSRFVLARLKQLAEDAAGASSLATLLGVEGSAARLYFEQLPGMLKQEDGDELPAFEFEHRNRRPPRDPVNALLSFAYSLLTKVPHDRLSCGRVRTVRRLLPSAAVRPPGARVGPDGGVPAARGRFGRAVGWRRVWLQGGR